MSRNMLLPFVAAILRISFAPGEEFPGPERTAAKANPFFINLADYAKGDGSDETEAIQRAFDALPPAAPKEHVTANHPGGVLSIPRPPVCYAISRTIKVVEKWNSVIRCETPVWGSRGMPVNHYFRWIGPDGGTMFEFRSSKGMIVENLSMTGLDAVDLDRIAKEYKLEPIGRHTRGVTGVLIGPENQQAGFQTSMIFDQLRIDSVAVGIKLGAFADNGPDVRELSFRNAFIGSFSKIGIWAASGNLANVTFQTLTTYGVEGAENAIRLDGGELLVLNWNGNGRNVKGAEVFINAGGIHIVKAWSEWPGPFLSTDDGEPEWTEGTYGSVNYPIILESIRHYEGSFMNQKTTTGKNPVPLSIRYNRPVPLHLIGCSLWGGVGLGAESMAVIIDQGTVFIDKDSVGFSGDGITKHRRVVHIGTQHSKNGRVLEPYFVDRRNTPGDSPPKTGVWEKGDGVINIDPDPEVPAKACRGWICVEPGEPGKWLPYGEIKRE